MRRIPTAPGGSGHRESSAAPTSCKQTLIGHRIEKDFLGEKAISDDACCGVQTLRGKENFHVTGLPMSMEPNFVKAFG